MKSLVDQDTAIPLGVACYLWIERSFNHQVLHI